MAYVKLKGREIPLLYTVYEMKAVQEEIAPIGELYQKIFGRNPEDENDRSMFGSAPHLDAVARLVRILGNAGLEEDGEAPDLTDKWVMRAIRPGQITEVLSCCMTAMNEAMESEYPRKESGEAVDVTLEDINKKKDGDRSPT